VPLTSRLYFGDYYEECDWTLLMNRIVDPGIFYVADSVTSRHNCKSFIFESDGKSSLVRNELF
jgi:hypothetical protein